MVATCGGRFLCIFHLRTGDLRLKYEHDEENLNFYGLAWTSLEMGNILATCSNTGEVRLFHPEREISFHSWSCPPQPPNKKSVSINAVHFHSEEATWLFTASKVSRVQSSGLVNLGCRQDGVICLWDFGNPAPPNYSNVTNHLLLKLNYRRANKNLYTMAWAGDKGTGWIMVGTEDGLMGWRISSSKVKEVKFPKINPKMVELK